MEDDSHLWPTRFMHNNAKPQLHSPKQRPPQRPPQRRGYNNNNNIYNGSNNTKNEYQSPNRKYTPRREFNREKSKFHDNSVPCKPLTWADDITTDWVMVSMGSGTAKKMLNPSISNNYDQILDSIWKTNRDGFPGSLAVSILQSQLESQVKPNKYHILPKTDGLRYIFFSFINPKTEEAIIDLIDRSGSHHKVALKFHQHVFDGTILDCELIQKDDKTYELQVFDCMVFQGVVVTNLAYSQRMEKAKIVVNDYYKYLEGDLFKIVIKTAITPDRALALLYCLPPELDYPTDGLILVCETLPYSCGRDDNLLKYKRKEDHTVDFKLKVHEISKGEFELRQFITERGKPQQVCAYIPNEEDIKKLNISSWWLVEDQIVECRWDTEFQAWRPYKIRFDKDIPNNLLTYLRTQQNIEEDISPEKLYKALTNL